MISTLTVTDWMGFNAKLQQKKNALRKALSEMGVLKKGGQNDYDKYRYFSEAQYKELFTRLLSEHGLELSFSELEYEMFEGIGKQLSGRTCRLQFTLTDTDTGFYETSIITGEGMDKGDKAGYKAYTGAVKYYLANTFMVATGDDPERESHSADYSHEGMKKQVNRKASAKQVSMIRQRMSEERLQGLLAHYQVQAVEELTMRQASDAISILMKEESN